MEKDSFLSMPTEEELSFCFSHLSRLFKQSFSTLPFEPESLRGFLPLVLPKLFDCIRHRSQGRPGWPSDITPLSHAIEINSSIEATFFYLLQRSIFLEFPKAESLPYLARLMKLRTGAEIYYSTQIGDKINIQHGYGTVVGPNNIIGDHFTIHQGVTIGQKKMGSPHDRVIIGNHVCLYAGAKVIGNITIGDNVQLGANSVLLENAKPNSVYAGVPAKRVKSLVG